jgi:hypothetical protein
MYGFGQSYAYGSDGGTVYMYGSGQPYLHCVLTPVKAPSKKPGGCNDFPASLVVGLDNRAGLARILYIHLVWPYLGCFPCQNYRI